MTTITAEPGVLILVASGRNRQTDHLSDDRIRTLCNLPVTGRINGPTTLATCRRCRKVARLVHGGCPCAQCRHS